MVNSDRFIDFHLYMTSAKSTQYLKNAEETLNENSPDSPVKGLDKNFSLTLNSGRPNIDAVKTFLVFINILYSNYFLFLIF